eukprot:4063914-Pleurochrysis_carterae.AAC.5
MAMQDRIQQDTYPHLLQPFWDETPSRPAAAGLVVEDGGVDAAHVAGEHRERVRVEELPVRSEAARARLLRHGVQY